MPLLRGETLEARLQRGALPLAEVLRIGREIAEGLAAIHAQGLVHRDLKPDNIWLESDGVAPPHAKIIDFGLAMRSGDAGPDDAGSLVGTPAYMSPEQAQGRRVEARSDLFSLGCVLYRLCTGRLPFPGPDLLSTLRQVVARDVVAPDAVNPELPAALAHLVLRLLEKEPAARPTSADAVVANLGSLERQTA